MSSCQDSTKYWKCGVETLEARVIGLEKLGKHDVELVGGKNSSLGEMISHLSNAGVSVPGGFATTAGAYREFLDQSGLNAKIQAELAQLNVEDVNALAQSGAKIRQWIIETPLTPEFEKKSAKHLVLCQTATRKSRLPFVLQLQLKTCLTLLCRPTRNLPEYPWH